MDSTLLENSALCDSREPTKVGHFGEHARNGIRFQSCASFSARECAAETSTPDSRDFGQGRWFHVDCADKRLGQKKSDSQ